MSFRPRFGWIFSKPPNTARIPELKERLAAVEGKAAQAVDPLAKWNECLQGGNAKAGRQIFSEMAEAACMRCHSIKGEGGDVGPDLAGIGQRHDRMYILQSIVDPNAVIAPGYENVVLSLQNGDTVVGILNKETADQLLITSLVDGKKQEVKKSTVKDRMNAPSPMPPGLGRSARASETCAMSSNTSRTVTIAKPE